MKHIQGYEGLYSVCPTGQIWAEPSNKRPNGCFLKPWLIGNGYEMVMLYRNRKPVKYLVHRLVAETFVPNPHKLKEVNHKDGDKRNNSFNNLEWVSSKDNKKHAWDNGLYMKKRKIHWRAKLTPKQVRAIRATKGTKSQREIAEDFKVSQMVISLIHRGITYTHIT